MKLDDRYVARFRIARGVVGAASETDGIDVVLGDVGAAFPQGLMIAQDGDNAPTAQNFKIVDWRAIAGIAAAAGADLRSVTDVSLKLHRNAKSIFTGNHVIYRRLPGLHP